MCSTMMLPLTLAIEMFLLPHLRHIFLITKLCGLPSDCLWRIDAFYLFVLSLLINNYT